MAVLAALLTVVAGAEFVAGVGVLSLRRRLREREREAREREALAAWRAEAAHAALLSAVRLVRKAHSLTASR